MLQFIGVTITLVTHDVAEDLYTLVNRALTALSKPTLKQPFVITGTLQADKSGGSVVFSIGDSAISTTNRGEEIYATQTWPMPFLEGGFLDLSQIYVMAGTTDGLKMNVTCILRAPFSYR